MANACSVDATVTIHLRRVETIFVQYGKTEREQLPPDRLRQIRIPYRTRHDQRPKHEEWRDHFEDFPIGTLLQVPLPKPPEEFFERALEAAAAFEREEHVIQTQAGDVVGRIAEFAPGAIQHREIRARPKQDVPWMEISVNLP